MKLGRSNMVIICSVYLTQSNLRPSKKGLLKSGPSKWFWYVAFVKHDSLGDNQKCLKGIFNKSHMKPGLSNMALVYIIY